MFLYKITVASGLVLKVLISVFEEGGVCVCGGGGGGGTHHKNQLNVLPFSPPQKLIYYIS